MAHPTPDTLALVALGEDASDEVLTHLGSCDNCFDEVRALQQLVAVGRSLGPDERLVAPHPRVWERIVESLGDGRVIPLPGAAALAPAPSPEVATAEAVPARRDRVPLGRRRWFAVAVAAAVALVFGLGGFVLRGLLDPGPDVVGATQLNALPQWAGANGTAAVEKDAAGGRTLVVTMEMPSTIAVDGTFEVWMSDSRATDMLPMGTMSGTTGRFPVPPSVDLASHPIIDVSLEPPDDTDPTHSDQSVLRGRLRL